MLLQRCYLNYFFQANAWDKLVVTGNMITITFIYHCCWYHVHETLLRLVCRPNKQYLGFLAFSPGGAPKLDSPCNKLDKKSNSKKHLRQLIPVLAVTCAATCVAINPCIPGVGKRSHPGWQWPSRRITSAIVLIALAGVYRQQYDGGEETAMDDLTFEGLATTIPLLQQYPHSDRPWNN